MKKSQELKIEAAQFKDIAIITEIEKASYSLPWSFSSFEEVLNLPHFWFWVARLQTRIVGYLICQVVGEEAELHNIAVAPTFRRQGIGRKMFEKLKAQLIKKEVRNLYLLVRNSNFQAKKLYFSFGFKKIGVRKDYYHDPIEDADVFSLMLDKKI